MASFLVDSLTDADATALAAHVGETGATWTMHPSATDQCYFFNNRVYSFSSLGLAYASGVPASADYSVAAVVRAVSQNGQTGPAARVSTSALTCYFAFYNVSTGGFELWKVVAGSFAQLGATYTATFANGDDATLEVVCLGNQISLKVGGTTRVGPVTDSSISAKGKAGLWFITQVSSLTGFHVASVQADDLGASISAVVTEQNLPSNHLGNITVHVVGTGTTFTTSTTWTASGLAGWSVASKTHVDGTHYTVVLTPPTAATPPAGPTGSLTLTEGVTGTVAATTTVGTPILSLSPSSGAPAATPTVTLTGSKTLWSSETAAGLFTLAGGTGASISTPTVTTNTAATATLTVGSATGTLTVTDTSTGATASFTATSGPATIPVTDANFYFDPLFTYCDGVGALGTNNIRAGSTYAQANTTPWRCRAGFSGTSAALVVDVSPLTAASCPANQYPVISWSVDGGPWHVRYQLQSTDTSIVLATGLTSGNHTVEVSFEYHWTNPTNNGSDVWLTPSNVLRITGLVVDAGATSVTLTGDLAPRADATIVDTDSTGEANYDDTGYATGYSRTTVTALTCRGLLSELVSRAFRGTGYTATFQNTPGSIARFGLFFNGASALVAGLFPKTVKRVIINQGRNDGSPASGDVKTLMESYRAACGSGTWIHVVIPFAGTGRTNISGGYSSYTAAHPSDARVGLIDLATDGYFGAASKLTLEGTHPDTYGASELAVRLVAAIRLIEDAAGGGTYDDPGTSNVKIGVGYVFNSIPQVGTYDGSDRWSDPGISHVEQATAYKANSTSNNRVGTLENPSDATIAAAIWVYANRTLTG